MPVGSNNNSILLQTTQAFVSRPDNQETGMCTQVIFDCCSQRSFITSKTHEQLNVPTVGKETLLIKTFGDNSASVKECDIVQLNIRTIDAMSVHHCLRCTSNMQSSIKPRNSKCSRMLSIPCMWNC